MHTKQQKEDVSSLEAIQHKIKQHKLVIAQADKGILS
jgi:hypothetical protein